MKPKASTSAWISARSRRGLAIWSGPRTGTVGRPCYATKRSIRFTKAAGRAQKPAPTSRIGTTGWHAVMSGEQRHEPFDVDVVMRRIREAVRPYPKPALFALADQGFTSPFEQLVACIISIRTRDEVTEPVAAELFRHARTPAEVSRLAPDEIDQLIRQSTFHHAKAPQILAIARRILDEYSGELPCDDDVLRSFEGVGPKCANLVLAI